MNKRRKLQLARRPKIKGRAKLVVKVTKHNNRYIAKGYVSQGKRCIGEISAYHETGTRYLTVGRARLKEEWTGREYGHILYWALAKKAIKHGYSGLRSSYWGRNQYSDGAWKKISTFSRNEYAYLKLS